MTGVARTRKGTVRLSAEGLSKRISGRVVAGVEELASGALVIRFEDGAHLAIEDGERGLGAILHDRAAGTRSKGPRPTRRQLEYLEFIRRYVHRYGGSPSETDIQAHFLVSAPSVNQMVRTLERRGFITRDRDCFGQTVPRSIRVLWEE
jgi:hypothetical protein